MKKNTLQPEVLLLEPSPKSPWRVFLSHSSDFKTSWTSIHAFSERKKLPDLTLVDAGRWQPSISEGLQTAIEAVAAKWNDPAADEPQNRFVVFIFIGSAGTVDSEWHRKLLKPFKDPTNVQIAFGEEEAGRNITGLAVKWRLLSDLHGKEVTANNPNILTELSLALNYDDILEKAVQESISDIVPVSDQPHIKLKLITALRKLPEKLDSEVSALPPPRTSPLDNVRKLVDATADLRAENGKLSAKKIADFFGLSLEELGRWVGRSRQALFKTPDSDGLQNDLGYLERIARLRAMLPDKKAFLHWLRMSNPALNGKSPFQLLEEKRWQALADFVEDILTGSPS